jgi:hypothetical protein
VDELEEVELLRDGGGGLGRDATADAVVVLRETEGVVMALAGRVGPGHDRAVDVVVIGLG